jgi:hypothetical protein
MKFKNRRQNSSTLIMFLDCISGAFDFLDKRFLWIIFHSEEENKLV